MLPYREGKAGICIWSNGRIIYPIQCLKYRWAHRELWDMCAWLSFLSSSSQSRACGAHTLAASLQRICRLQCGPPLNQFINYLHLQTQMLVNACCRQWYEILKTYHSFLQQNLDYAGLDLQEFMIKWALYWKIPNSINQRINDPTRTSNLTGNRPALLYLFTARCILRHNVKQKQITSVHSALLYSSFP